MNFPTAVKTCFRKYATFSGRASRFEYGCWLLFFYFSLISLSYIEQIFWYQWATAPLPPNAIMVGFNSVFALATLLPHLAVMTRRLHDLDWSGRVLWKWPLFTFIFFLIAGAIGFFWPSDCRGLNCLDKMKYPVFAAAGFGVVMLAFQVALVVIAFLKSPTPGPNRFGPDPLA